MKNKKNLKIVNEEIRYYRDKIEKKKNSSSTLSKKAQSYILKKKTKLKESRNRGLALKKDRADLKEKKETL